MSKIISTRTTSTHRPLWLKIGKEEYKVDGIDTSSGKGEYTIEQRWIIQELLQPFDCSISTHEGGHGEFYVSNYSVPMDYDLLTSLKEYEDARMD